MTDFLIKPSVNNRSLFKLKKSINEKGEITKIPIIEEKPLTLYLNNQEIVTKSISKKYTRLPVILT